MSDFHVVETRARHDETWHRVRVAVVTADGDFVIPGCNPDGLIFWRSTAKPFQLWPLIAGGGVERFGLEPRHLAIACASHSATIEQRTVVSELLRLVGVAEADLACGGHLSLSGQVADQMIRDGVVPTPIWSNCSGKHSAMLGLARQLDWPIEGYERLEHPVQQTIAGSVARWSDLSVDQLVWGVDGCTAAAVATPLSSLALAWARLGSTDEPALATIRAAMLSHPDLVAGPDRFDTVLMQEWSGKILVKVGAGGVYAASIVDAGIGIALKVEDGDMRTAAIALVGLLRHLVAVSILLEGLPMAGLARWDRPEIRNTRGEPVGHTEIRIRGMDPGRVDS